jgi:serine/threonine-protein kinase
MKLVKGETLDALLASRARPADALPRFLTIFEQVCQTVAYAHSKGVIHRDLKPSNVMVGTFGEVQVMDWGLAKLLVRPADVAVAAATAQASTFYTTRRPGSPEETQPGTVLGTPAFMPPEQARGQTAHLDARADVFALGGILCAILTGHPPYEGGDVQEVLRRAAEGDLAEARARLTGHGADEELVRLTLACLAFQPSERPRDAAAVAARVAAYLAAVQERLRAAEIERAAAQARAEAEARERQAAEARAEAENRERRAAQAKAAAERRARRLTLGLAAAVLLLVLAGGGSAWWMQQFQAAEQARRREVGEKTRLALERGRGLLDAGWDSLDEARLKDAQAEADQAVESAAGGAPEEVRQEAIAFQEEVRQRRNRAKRDRALMTDLLDIVSPLEYHAYKRNDVRMAMTLPQPDVEEQYAAAFRR